jgi:hypothetical protein
VTRRAMIAGVLVSAACMSAKDRFPTAEAAVRRSLPLGMKVEEVARALDSMGIAHSRPKTDSLRMVALVPAVATTPLFTADALFELLFDSAGRLTRINAKRISKGP